MANRIDSIVLGVPDISGLGTAATKGVGTGTGQIPDMAAFLASRSDFGYQQLPGGLIIQWGLAAAPNGSLSQRAYQVAFPNAALRVFLCHNAAGNAVGLSGASLAGSKTLFEYLIHVINVSGTTVTAAAAGSSSVGMHFLAIGY